MRRMPFLLIGVVALLLACLACTDDISEVQQGTLKKVVITASDFELEDGSRTNFKITNNGAEFSWAANDTVGIFPNEGAQAYFPMTSGAGTKTANFTGGGWALKDASTYAAYYPFIGDFYLDKNAIPMDYTGQVQTGDESTTHLGAYDFMAAIPAAPVDGCVNFAFKHLGALVQLKLTIPEPTTIHSVSLITESAAFTTKGKVDIMSSNPGITPVTKSKNLNLEIKDITTTKANQVVTLYLMIPPVDLSNKTLKAVVNISSGSKEASLTSKNFLAGKAYALTGTVDEIVDTSIYDAVIGENTEIIDATFASYVTNTVNGSTINMNATTPAELLPKTGQILLCGVEDEKFPYGFAGKVRRVTQDANGYIIETRQAELGDIFESISATGEMEMEIEQQVESRSSRKKIITKRQAGLELSGYVYKDNQNFQGVSLDMTLDLSENKDFNYSYMEGSFGSNTQIHSGLDIGFRCSYNLSENMEGRPDCFNLYFDILQKQECNIALDFDGYLEFNHKLAEVQFKPLKLNLANCIKNGKNDSRAVQAVIKVVFAILNPKLELNYKTTAQGKMNAKLDCTKSTITKFSIENNQYDINTIEGEGEGIRFTNIELEGEAKTGINFKFSMLPIWTNRKMVDVDFYAGPQITGTAEYGDETENNTYFDIVPLDMTLNGQFAVYPILKNTQEAIFKASFEKDWKLGKQRRWLFPRYENLNAYLSSGNSQKIIVSTLLKDSTAIPVNVGFSLYDKDDNLIETIQTMEEYNLPSSDEGTYLEDEFINIDKSKLYYVKPTVELLGKSYDYSKKIYVTSLREALIKLYQSTNGDKWTRNDNWCSDRPITEWYGILSDTLNYCFIDLNDNNLTGKIEQTFPCNIDFTLSCSGNQITSIDVSGSTSLYDLDFNNNPLTLVDLSGCTRFKTIMGAPIIVYPMLVELELPLGTLNISGCTQFTSLYFYNSKIKSLNITDCTALTDLKMNNNGIDILKITNCTSLAYLDMYTDYSFGTLEITGCTALESLNLNQFQKNKSSSLKVSDCTALKDLNCSDTHLTSIEIKNCIALEGLFCENNQLSSLDLSNYTALKHLDCSNNQLRSLNVSNCMALEKFSCDNNQLTSLDLSNRTALKELSCSNNQLTSLNLSSSSALEVLNCENNQIKSEITDWFPDLFIHDVRYEYYKEQNEKGEWVDKYKDNGVGWWYIQESQKKGTTGGSKQRRNLICISKGIFLY